MKAVIWDGPGRIVVVDKPVPDVLPGYSLVRVEFAGICATDRELVAGAIPAVVPGVTPGHEIVGVVVDSRAPGALLPGTRVVVDTVFGCGECARCRAGEFSECAEPQELGYTADGGWAEFVLVRNSHQHPVPGILAPRDAALCEPFAMPFGSLLRSGEMVAGRSILVVGSGIAALGFASAAIALGAERVDVSLRGPARAAVVEAIDPRVRARVEGVGIADPGAFDIAVDTIGSSASIRTAVAGVRAGGHVMAYGLHERDVDFPLADLVLRNIRLAGYVNPPNIWPTFLERVGEGAIRLDGLVDRVISIDEVPSAVAEWGGNLRTVIAFRPDGEEGAG